MPLEVRILTGARAGQVLRFDKGVIVVGRHAVSDLRFDPEKDLDVSGRHAEIRFFSDAYAVHDTGSTNGTFVNGKKVQGSASLDEGDRIRFGQRGPEVEVSMTPGRLSAAPRPATGSTEQRIAVAVQRQTVGLKRVLYAAVVLLFVGVGGAFVYGRRESAKRIEELRRLLAMNDSVAAILQGGMRQAGDTALLNAIEGKIRELRQRLPGATGSAERDQIAAEIAANERQLRRMVQMDLPAIHARNAPAVAILVAEIGGVPYAGSGFAIDSSGVLITNRHNVRTEKGDTATRIAVKFSETTEWLSAQVMRVSDDAESDLALIRIDRPGKYPAVERVASAGSDVVEGVSVVTIGFPLGYDTPMEGAGNDFLAKSSLNPGTVSKRTTGVLQIDSYAAHGSSGSPVFDARGRVIGVVWGGPPGAGGRIVYAVPPAKLGAFIPSVFRGIVRD
jgi:S1-C subfamily serine protease/pSer/pThr/pTyr-binding forkhead associated (FHA) protein